MGAGVVLGVAEDVVELAARRVGAGLRAPPPNPPPRRPRYVTEEKESVSKRIRYLRTLKRTKSNTCADPGDEEGIQSCMLKIRHRSRSFLASVAPFDT
jgi:hypothetical protein